MANKEYDLEERVFKFSWDVRALVNKLPKTITNIEDAKAGNKIFRLRRGKLYRS